MQDLTESTLDRIEQHRIPGLDLGAQTIYPNYDGLSILNLPASISRWLGAGVLAHPPLQLAKLDELAEGINQVILVLVDAVSFDRCRRWLSRSARAYDESLEDGLLFALTSIVPSTTCAALTTLWTGRSPAEHGILGYELFLREFSLVANMITHSPVGFDGQAGLLYEAGFSPEEFLPVDTIGPLFDEKGVQTHAFLHYSISGSGLSRMHYEHVNQHPFASSADLWVKVRRLANSPPEDRRFIWVYYGGVDGISHLQGPDSDEAEATFKSFTDALVEQFLNGVDTQIGAKTLFLMIADHGQVHTRKDPHYALQNHPNLTRRLHILPTGENRLAYLYPKPGQTDAIEEYIERSWPGSFTTAPSNHALHSGLFGPGTPSPSTLDRIGDRIVLSHGDAYLWWASKQNPLLGRHGGLTREEMLVPLLAKRLG